MSGDVFGNGMLLSEHIRLVAAFDHRHIFVDPDPGRRRRRSPSAGGCSTCRARRGPTTTRSLISRGRRRLRPRRPSRCRSRPRWPQALGPAPSGATSLTPAELMKAILLAPVDLLWNGGIGTYVKAVDRDATPRSATGPTTRSASTASELRCKVVGEGGNLGLTPARPDRGRAAGVRVNTDAIDNSAGVDTSDHEVNIKILLDRAGRATAT